MDERNLAPEPPRASLQPRPPSFIERLPSWAFLVLLGGIILAMWLVNLTGPGNPVEKYIWEPIVEDEGYNVINTILLMVVLGCILGWLYRLMKEWNERVDLELTIALIPYLVWGSIFRVLEDSDLFAPFGEEIIRAGGTKAGASCWMQVGGGFLHECFGVFYITPIIYVVVTFIAVFCLWLGRHAARISRHSGPAAGLRFYGLSLVGLLALYMALWAGDQTFIRWVANPAVAVAACAVAYLIVWRDTAKRGAVNARWAMFAYSCVFLIVGLYYVLVWMTGGRGVWAPSGTVQWWVLVALILAPLLVALASAKVGRALAKVSGPRAQEPGRLVAVLTLLVILEGVAIFLSILGAHGVETRLDDGTLWTDVAGTALVAVQLLVGPLFLFFAIRIARGLAAGRMGAHPALVFFASPVNLLMVFGQSADGLMTSLGIDVFHYSEKHVLPGFLIEFVDGLNLPGPIGDYPAATVMIPLKVLIVLAVVWLIDIGARDEAVSRQNLVGLVKMAIIMVGLSPGVRDAVRLAMAT